MWIETKSNGWLNLDRATSIKRHKDEWVVRGWDGEQLGTIYGNRDMDTMIGAAIVPASAGQVAWVVDTYPDDKSQIVVNVESAAIVAWRVDRTGAFPVLAGERLVADQTVLIVHPDGRCEEPFVGTWMCLEDAIAAIQAQAQEDLDVIRGREQAAIE